MQNQYNIYNNVKWSVKAERASFFFVDADAQEMFATIFETGEEIRVNWEKGLVGHACLTSTILNLEDAYKYPLFNPTIDRHTGFHTKAVLCLPILGVGGEVVACVQFINKVIDGAKSYNNNNASNKRTDDDEFRLINPDYFDLKDLKKAKEMLGELLYDMCPLPLENIPAFNHCPVYIRKSYLDSFFPSNEDFHGSNVIRKHIKRQEEAKRKKREKKKQNLKKIEKS